MDTSLDVILGLGSNVGSREALLRAAIDLLAATPGVDVISRSPLYETAPVGPPQPRYLNAAVRLRCALAPGDLLDRAARRGATLGRAFGASAGAPRTLDLDVPLDRRRSRAHSEPTFTVPHPELLAREFALRPLLALGGDAIDPRDGAPLARALDAARARSVDPDRARPFAEAVSSDEVEHTADEGFVTRALDRADLLAAAAEAMGALVVDPASVVALRAVPVSVTLDADAADDERLFAWLSEVLYHLDAGRLALRRAVVFDDGRRRARGALRRRPRRVAPRDAQRAQGRDVARARGGRDGRRSLARAGRHRRVARRPRGAI